MKVIGHIRTDFPSKFGIPRQSGLIDGLKGKIILEPEYRNPQVYKGIEEFSHIWLLWEFSEAKKEHLQLLDRHLATDDRAVRPVNPDARPLPFGEERNGRHDRLRRLGRFAGDSHHRIHTR